MKSLIIVLLAFGTFSIFRTFGSSNKELDQLQFFKLGIVKSELEKKFGRPVYQKKNLEEYLLSDKSIFRVMIDQKKNSVESATLEFNKPIALEAMSENTDKNFILYQNEKINTATPTYFYAALKEKGMLWKVLINGKVASVSWVTQDKITETKSSQKQTLDQLLTTFRNEKK